MSGKDAIWGPDTRIRTRGYRLRFRSRALASLGGRRFGTPNPNYAGNFEASAEEHGSNRALSFNGAFVDAPRLTREPRGQGSCQWRL